jgi:hypothetical protein
VKKFEIESSLRMLLQAIGYNVMHLVGDGVTLNASEKGSSVSRVGKTGTRHDPWRPATRLS